MALSEKTLQGISKKIYESVKIVGSNRYERFKSILDNTLDLMRKQRIFFTHIEPSDLIKIICYIYSLKTSNGLSEGNKILSNLHLIKTFSTEYETVIEECNWCGGNGTETCGFCTNGTVPCENCDEDGQIECPDCDGVGTLQHDDGEEEVCDMCSGSGQLTCDKCGGEGDVDCPECGGDAYQNCSECGGEGEVENRFEHYYAIDYWLTWDPNFIDFCELRMLTLRPIGNNVSGDEIPAVFFNQYKQGGSINPDVKQDELYCISCEPIGASHLIDIDLNLGRSDMISISARTPPNPSWQKIYLE